jgi:hypothetical protein
MLLVLVAGGVGCALVELVHRAGRRRTTVERVS